MTNLLCQLLARQDDPAQVSLALHGLSLLDWDALLQVTQHHGLLQVLHHRLHQPGIQFNPPRHVSEHLYQANLLVATRNMLFLHAAGILLSALRKKGLEVIALKGIYLVENVYPDIAMRTFGDIDLLVHKTDLPAVIRCIEGLDYHISTYFDVHDLNTEIKHVPPMFKTDSPIIEIHWTILEEDEPFTIDTEGLWQRSTPAQVAGVDVLALGVEDLLLHLCTHLGYQHQLKIGLKGLYDIAVVLDHFQGQVDWHKLICIAKQWGVERVVWLVFKLAEDLLGAEVLKDVYSQLVSEPIPLDLLVDAKTHLLEGEYQSAQMTPDLARLATTNGFASRLRLMTSRVFIPKQTLARLYNVSPKSLKIVWCYFRRFADLVRQYGPTLKHVMRKEQAVMAGVTAEESTERLRAWMGKMG